MHSVTQLLQFLLCNRAWLSSGQVRRLARLFKEIVMQDYVTIKLKFVQ
jgi:hypothetical protein